MDSTKKETALAFLKMHKTGSLATVSRSGEPRNRLVYYACDDSFSVYFLTLENTRKAEDLALHPRAAFTVAVEGIPQTIQLEGAVRDITDTATIDPVVISLTEHLHSNTEYGAPLRRFDTAKIRYFRLTPDWVRFGDFTSGWSSTEVFTEIPVI